MEKLWSTVTGTIGSLIGKILDEVVELLVKLILGPMLENCLEAGTTIYNSMLNGALDIMTLSPDLWNKTGWSFIANEVNVIFVTVGCSLVVVFFLIGFCAEYKGTVFFSFRLPSKNFLIFREKEVNS